MREVVGLLPRKGESRKLRGHPRTGRRNFVSQKLMAVIEISCCSWRRESFGQKSKEVGRKSSGASFIVVCGMAVIGRAGLGCFGPFQAGYLMPGRSASLF